MQRPHVDAELQHRWYNEKHGDIIFLYGKSIPPIIFYGKSIHPFFNSTPIHYQVYDIVGMYGIYSKW